MGEADAVAGGEYEVGVVHQPVDGGVGDGLGHELVEAGGVQVRAQSDRAFLVGGVDDAVERFGGLGCDGEQADVVDDDDVGAFEGVEPKLDRLGGESWQKAKRKVKKSLRNMAQQLLSVHAARELAPGFAFSPRYPPCTPMRWLRAVWVSRALASG